MSFFYFYRYPHLGSQYAGYYLIDICSIVYHINERIHKISLNIHLNVDSLNFLEEKRKNFFFTICPLYGYAEFMASMT